MENYNCASCCKDMQHDNIEMDALKLECIYIRAKSPCVWDVLMVPLFEGPLHFCGIGCLRNWIEKQKSILALGEK